jgi:atypical dual specificity phosphatase
MQKPTIDGGTVPITLKCDLPPSYPRIPVQMTLSVSVFDLNNIADDPSTQGRKRMRTAWAHKLFAELHAVAAHMAAMGSPAVAALVEAVNVFSDEAHFQSEMIGTCGLALEAPACANASNDTCLPQLPSGTDLPSREPAKSPVFQCKHVQARTHKPAPTSGASRLAPQLLFLVGLPGSGKSTFASALLQSDEQWCIISQDDIGGRSQTETAFGRAVLHSGRRVILDRVNAEATDRRYWLELAGRPKSAMAVFFDYTTSACTERVTKRINHPTIPYGHGKNAVESFAKKLEAPQRGEGFEAVLVVRSLDECNGLLHRLGAAPVTVDPPGFFKFPRTRHVVNTGGSAVSRDDIVMTLAEAEQFFKRGHIVAVEEKVDGANLGISIDAAWQVVCQNRSHFVTAATHSQFKSLNGWIDQQRWALSQVLMPDREILFGEWCYARHSIAYSKLPAYFIAFDIFDRTRGAFLSRAERDARLAPYDIPVVPLIAERTFSSMDELLALLSTRSTFYDGFVEGVYLRIDDMLTGLNIARGKIVRPDFIQGITEHWQSKKLERNGLLDPQYH